MPDILIENRFLVPKLFTLPSQTAKTRDGLMAYCPDLCSGCFGANL